MGIPVTLNGSGSTDPDGEITNYTWTMGDETTLYGEEVTHTYTAVGTYTVNLTVKDDQDATDSDSCKVKVHSPPPVAVADATPSEAYTDDSIQFDGTGSYDPDGDVVNWSWDFGDGETGYGNVTSHSYDDNGTYTVQLTVKDNDDETNTTSIDVSINNRKPSAGFTFSPDTPDTQDSITFTDESTDPDGSIDSWEWDFDDGNDSTAQNPSHTYADDGTYTVTLTVEDNDGATDSVSHTVTVQNVGPTAAFSYTPSSPDTQDSISFTDESTDPDGSIDSWEWDFGDGNDSTAQNPSHTYADDGTYTVTLTVEDNDGATDSVSHTVTVQNVGPTAAFSYSPEHPDAGDTVSFVDHSSDSDGSIATYEWDFGDGNDSSAQNPSHTYADDGTYTVTLTVEDDDGATDSTTTSVAVGNVPNVDFTFTPSNPKTGESIQFTDQSSDPDGGAIQEWKWRFDDGNESSAQNPSHTYADDGTYDVELTVTDDEGKQATGSKKVTVSNRDPSAGFTFSPDTPDTQDSISFTDESTDPDGSIDSWEWDFDDGNDSSAQNPSHTYADDGTYTVTLTVEDNDGATDSVSHTVTVQNVGPTAAFSYSPEHPVRTDSVKFTDQSSEPDGTIASYSWDFGDESGTSSEPNPSYSYGSDGNYTVTLTVEDDDGATDSVSQTIRIFPVPPVANFSFTPHHPTTSDVVQFTDQSTPGDAPIQSYKWAFGDGNSSSQQDPTHQYANNEVYTVKLTVTDGNGQNDTVEKTVSVGNVPPTASIGNTPPVEAHTYEDITFDGSASTDSDGNITVYRWDWTSDGSWNQESDAATATHSYTAAGTYTATLQVEDDDGATDNATVVVTISNSPPSASFTYTPSSPDTQDSITFINTSDDVDGTIVSVQWDFDDGNDSSAQNPSHTYADDGTYTVTLTVEDNDGATDSVSHTVTVQNVGPTAAFSYTPSLPDTQDSITFTDESTDPDGSIDSWEWDFDDGNESTAQNPSHTYADDGTYDVELTVTDDDGTASTMSKTVTVSNTPPTAAFTVTTSVTIPGETLTFKADTSYDLDGFITECAWQLGDGVTKTGEQITHAYAHNGSYEVTLTVEDNDGGTDSESRTITVTAPPVASFTYTIEEGNVTFNASGSHDPDGSIESYSWDFGDGAAGTGENVTHSYSQSGTYHVTLTVTDNEGKSNQTHTNVTVDLEPPVTAMELSPGSPNGHNGWYVTSVTVTLDATDTISENTTTKYRFDDTSSWNTYTDPIQLTTAGVHVLSYRSIDESGNIEAASNATIKIDTSRPSTTLSPSINESTWYTEPVTLSLAGYDGVSGSTTYYRVVGKTREFKQYSEPLNISQEGTHIIQYFTRDRAGNAETLHNVTLHIDTAQPELQVTTPRASHLYLFGREVMPLEGMDRAAVVIGSLDIEVTASDTGAGIQDVSFYLEDELQHTDGGAPYMWQWDMRAIGAYTIEVVAADNAGRTASTNIYLMAFNL